MLVKRYQWPLWEITKAFERSFIRKKLPLLHYVAQEHKSSALYLASLISRAHPQISPLEPTYPREYINIASFLHINFLSKSPSAHHDGLRFRKGSGRQVPEVQRVRRLGRLPQESCYPKGESIP